MAPKIRATMLTVVVLPMLPVIAQVGMRPSEPGGSSDRKIGSITLRPGWANE